MNNKTKWTPGPWSVDWVRTGAEVFAHDKESLMTLCRPVTEIMANAHLIAAAPQLYDVLESARSEVERLATEEARSNRWPLPGKPQTKWKDLLSHIDSALAKARGDA